MCPECENVQPADVLLGTRRMSEREAAEHADAVEEVAHRDDGAEHARDAGEEPEDHPHPRGLVLIRPRLLDDLYERVFKPLDVVDLLLLQFNFPFFSS